MQYSPNKVSLRPQNDGLQKVMDVMDKQQMRVSAYTQVKMEDAPIIVSKISEVRMSRYLDTSTNTQMA